MLPMRLLDRMALEKMWHTPGCESMVNRRRNPLRGAFPRTDSESQSE